MVDFSILNKILTLLSCGRKPTCGEMFLRPSPKLTRHIRYCMFRGPIRPEIFARTDPLHVSLLLVAHRHVHSGLFRCPQHTDRWPYWAREPSRPFGISQSVFYSLTCLTVECSTVGIALEVIEVCKPPCHDKVSPMGERGEILMKITHIVVLTEYSLETRNRSSSLFPVL